MLPTIYFILVLTELVFCQQHVWTDEHVINALGDHGDRLSDLEKLVKTLLAGQRALQKEVDDLNVTNTALSLQLQNITDSCINIMKCSDTKHDPYAHASTIITNNASQPFSGTTAQGQYASYVTSNMTHNLQTTTAAMTLTSTIPTSTTTGQKGFQSCSDALTNGTSNNGTFDVHVGISGSVATVFCEKVNDDVWMVVQRRKDGSVKFNRNWQDYKDGFGDLNGEFWLGNENLYQVTSNGVYTLRIEMNDWGGNLRHVQYEHFSVDSESNQYTLTVGSYQGTAGDSFHYHESQLLRHHGMPFSTPDRDNDKSAVNCAKKLHSGWWFNSCYSSNLNGMYLPNPYGQRMLGESYGEPTLDGTGIEWYPYRHRQYSMKTSKMMIKQASSGMHQGMHLVGRK